MKNVFKVKTILGMVGIIALVAIIGFSFAACDNGTTSNNDANGNENNNGNENGGDTHTYSVAADWDYGDIINPYAWMIVLDGEEDPREDHPYINLALKSGEYPSAEVVKSFYTVTIDGEAYSWDNFDYITSMVLGYGSSSDLIKPAEDAVIKIKYTPTGDDEKDLYFLDDWTDEVIAKVEAFEITATYDGL